MVWFKSLPSPIVIWGSSSPISLFIGIPSSPVSLSEIPFIVALLPSISSKLFLDFQDSIFDVLVESSKDVAGYPIIWFSVSSHIRKYVISSDEFRGAFVHVSLCHPD
jgi:hypothetical protein